MSNLAVLLQHMNQHKEAEPLCRSALDGRKTVLGPVHPDTLQSCHNLAVLLQAMKKYGEAEPFCRSALEGREKTLGKTHPDTEESRNNLSGLLQSLGKRHEAEQLRCTNSDVAETTATSVCWVVP